MDLSEKVPAYTLEYERHDKFCNVSHYTYGPFLITIHFHERTYAKGIQDYTISSPTGEYIDGWFGKNLNNFTERAILSKLKKAGYDPYVTLGDILSEMEQYNLAPDLLYKECGRWVIMEIPVIKALEFTRKVQQAQKV